MFLTTNFFLGTENMTKKNILAGAEVFLWDKEGGTKFFALRRITVRRSQKDGETWVAWPSHQYERDGETKYQNIVFAGPDSEEVRNKINNFVLRKFREKAEAEGRNDLLSKEIPQTAIPAGTTTTGAAEDYGW